MFYIIFGAGILIVSIVFRLAAVFRLTIPLLYALLMPTLFSGWYYSHQALAEGIWYAMLALVVLSWVISLVRKISGMIARRRSDRTHIELLMRRVREAGRNGGGTVRVDDLLR